MDGACSRATSPRRQFTQKSPSRAALCSRIPAVNCRTSCGGPDPRRRASALQGRPQPGPFRALEAAAKQGKNAKEKKDGCGPGTSAVVNLALFMSRLLQADAFAQPLRRALGTPGSAHEYRPSGKLGRSCGGHPAGPCAACPGIQPPIPFVWRYRRTGATADRTQDHVETNKPRVYIPCLPCLPCKANASDVGSINHQSWLATNRTRGGNGASFQISISTASKGHGRTEDPAPIEGSLALAV